MAETLEILRRLSNAGAEFVLIGGVAAIHYGGATVTDDVDICAPMDRANVVRIVTALADVEPRWRFRPDIYLRTKLGILDVLGELPDVCERGPPTVPAAAALSQAFRSTRRADRIKTCIASPSLNASLPNFGSF